MPPSRKYKVWASLAIVVILGLMWPVQMASFNNQLVKERRARASVVPYYRSPGTVEKFGGYIAGESATGAFMAGFRNIARTMLWIKVDELWHGGRWYRMLPVMVAITRVDPYFITVWEVFGWHLAWNLNAATKEESIQAARDIEVATKLLHREMQKISPRLSKPLADDLAGAQREAEVATRELDEAYTDERRLKDALGELREALQHLNYAWGSVRDVMPNTEAMGAVTNVQADLFGAAEKLVRSRREERRWIREGIAVDKAGIKTNPHRYEMYWELAWLYFDRIKEYDKAEKQLLLTLHKFPANPPESKSQPEPSKSPFYVYHALAHCYEYQLEIDKAIAAWHRVQREVPDHPVPEVPERSLKELQDYGNDPVWGMIMIQREERIRKGRYLPPWDYTSPQGKAALAWWAENKDDPEAVERLETLERKLRGAPEETKPKRGFEHDQPHHQPADGTT